MALFQYDLKATAFTASGSKVAAPDFPVHRSVFIARGRHQSSSVSGARAHYACVCVRIPKEEKYRRRLEEERSSCGGWKVDGGGGGGGCCRSLQVDAVAEEGVQYTA